MCFYYQRPIKNNSSRWLRKIRPSKGQHGNKLPSFPVFSIVRKKRLSQKWSKEHSRIERCFVKVQLDKRPTNISIILKNLLWKSKLVPSEKRKFTIVPCTKTLRAQTDWPHRGRSSGRQSHGCGLIFANARHHRGTCTLHNNKWHWKELASSRATVTRQKRETGSIVELDALYLRPLGRFVRWLVRRHDYCNNMSLHLLGSMAHFSRRDRVMYCSFFILPVVNAYATRWNVTQFVHRPSTFG